MLLEIHTSVALLLGWRELICSVCWCYGDGSAGL